MPASVKADLADQFLALGQIEKAQEQVQEIRQQIRVHAPSPERLSWEL